MKKINILFLVGIMLLVSACISVTIAILFSPSYVEATFSPDGDLASSTTRTINALRTGLGGLSIGLALAGIVSLICARNQQFRSSIATFTSRIIAPLLRPITKLPLWIIPLTLIILMLPVKGVTTSPDTANLYLPEALDIFQGEGYDHVKRGPVFPGLIAFSFSIFGVSLMSALFVIRICFLASVMLAYAIGARIGGKWSGLLASLLVLSSAALNTTVYSYILTDGMVATFVLLFVYTFIRALDTGLVRWHVAAGASLAVAYLTKEMSLLMFPLPIMMLFLTGIYRKKEYRVGMTALYVALLAIILPWAIYVYSLSGSFIGLIGKSGMSFLQQLTTPNASGTGFNILGRIGQLFESLRTYYHVTFTQMFALSPLFLLTWLALAIRSIVYRKPADLLLILAIVLYTPVMLFVGDASLGWPARHSSAVYLLTYLAFAYLCISGASALYRMTATRLNINTRPKMALNALLVVIIVASVSIQVIGDRDMLRLWTGNRAGSNLQTAYGMSYYLSTEFTVGGWHNSYVRSAATWLKQHSSASTAIISDWYQANSFSFFTRHEVEQFDYVNSRGFRQTEDQHSSRGRTLFLWTRSTQPGATVYAVKENDLLAQLERSEADYVVTTLRRNFLSIYFSQHSGFERVAQFGNGRIKIFRVLEFEPINDFTPHITTKAMKMLNNWARTNKDSYSIFVNDFMIGFLGLDREIFTPPQTRDEFKLIKRFTVYN